MSGEYTHDELVQKAKRWLTSTMGCGFALTELQALNSTGEIPDTIGFHTDYSILVECKTSRSDFHSDKKKMFRQFPKYGMGNYRYYLSEKDVVRKEDVPEQWGLLHVKGGKVYRIIDARNEKGGNIPSDKNKFSSKEQLKSERSLMYSALRRLELRDRLDEIYDYDNI